MYVLLDWASSLATSLTVVVNAVAFRIYDVDEDGYISREDLFTVLKMMVGNNIPDEQLQQIVDTTIKEARNPELEGSRENCISRQEFDKVLENTDVESKMSIRF